MSVINKMLRDLDQRQARTLPETIVVLQPMGHGALQSAAADVASQRGPLRTVRHQRQVWWWMGGVSLLSAVVATAWWWQSRSAVPAALPTATLAPTVVAVNVAEISQPTVPKLQAELSDKVARAGVEAQVVNPTAAAIAVAPAVSAPVALTASTEVLPANSRPTVAGNLKTAAAVAPAAAPAAPEATAALGLRLDANLRTPKSVESPVAVERPVNPRPDAAATSASEALERAQALWNAGSRDAAREFLQDAVVVAERQGAGGSFPQGNSALLPLVRELTRMQLADARHGAVLDLLTRLELQLGNVPDLWAIRGNAAQRLGRHQDSVHAYMVALQSRPNEQRWLLGAAVSLAALGQFNSAAEMADKARAVGVISPEVVVYLRQQGVPVSDK